MDLLNTFWLVVSTGAFIALVVILATLGAAVGIKRLEVKQLEAPKRKPADPNKPKKPRKSGAKVAA